MVLPYHSAPADKGGAGQVLPSPRHLNAWTSLGRFVYCADGRGHRGDVSRVLPPSLWPAHRPWDARRL